MQRMRKNDNQRFTFSAQCGTIKEKQQGSF